MFTHVCDGIAVLMLRMVRGFREQNTSPNITPGGRSLQDLRQARREIELLKTMVSNNSN
jgi:hypothetical protein